jgi:thiol-disulfide isomerase/thioredoxin
MSAHRFFRSIALVLVVAVLATASACTSNSQSDSEWPKTEVVDISKNTVVTTDEVVGEGVTIINLWALWCAPCREELPRLQKISVDFAGSVHVVGINIGDDFNKTLNYITEAGLTFPMYWDETGELLTALKVPSVPATLAVDASGTIIWTHLGALSASDLINKVSSFVR